MNFITARDALQALLDNNKGANFRVLKYRGQSISSINLKGTDRAVQVYVKKGDFPKSGGSRTGDIDHIVNFFIEMKVSEPATADLTVLNNPASTDAQRQTALDEMSESAYLADRSFDTLFSLLWNIVMDAQNQEFADASDPLIITDSWVDSWEKDEPLEKGEYVTVTGLMVVSAKVYEEVNGKTPTEGLKQISNTYEKINDDTIQQTEIISPEQ